MSKINNVSRVGVWSDSVSTINGNFIEFETELTSIENDLQKCKGLFPSLTKLKTEYPNPSVGSWAYIGTSLPAKIYVYRTEGGWIDTGKTGGGNVNPSQYANSSILNNPTSLYSMSISWLQGTNGNWNSVSGNKLKVKVGATQYLIRPDSLTFGEDGELLEPSVSDPYLMIFKKGSFVSMNLRSSGGVSKNYTENTLSWTIDDTFYKKTVGGQVINRMPVAGDELRATLKFRSPTTAGDRVLVTIFKFSN